jgi:hypothetical protein
MFLQFVCNLASLLVEKGCVVGRDERNAESWAIKSNIGFQKSARCMFFRTPIQYIHTHKEHLQGTFSNHKKKRITCKV